jgi:starch-binding outer membrane protein, SusD/RagB family
MKSINILKYLVVSMAIIAFSACSDDFLERIPLNSPSSGTFLSSEAEVELAINNAYRGLWFLGSNVPYELLTDCATDLGWIRGDAYGAQLHSVARGNATPNTGVFGAAWSHYYSYIARVNFILNNLERARENGVNENVLKDAEAQAKFLRAYFYAKLTDHFGDVPLVLTPLTLEESTQQERTAKSTVVNTIMDDLDFAIANLPETRSADNKGRATSGAALALKARVALYNELYNVAVQASNEIITSGLYSLHNDYGQLFQYEGQGNSEAILDMGFHQDVQPTNFALLLFSRTAGGWSILKPSRYLVDSYECIDGLPIDESPLYDPAKPYENRDPRLTQSIVHPESWWGPILFETHPDSLTTLRVVNGDTIAVDNQEVLNAFATFTGYLWRKYNSPNDIGAVRGSTISFILMRYAEVLLTYAEAKIELGEIDNSVLTAINLVRARAYAGTTIDFPEVTTLNQDELRRIVRRERKVELAGEGFRLSDIRRWRIAENVMNGPFAGRKIKERWYSPGVPTIDETGHPVYSDFSQVFTTLETRTFNPSRDYLWAIPQEEMDVFPGWSQNPGY